MLEWIHSVTSVIGYPGIALLMFVENVFPPLPSELIVPLAGFAAAQGDLSLVGVISAGSLGSLLGQLPYYALSYWVGEKTLYRLADRYGRWVMVSSHELKRADRWFNRYGRWAVFCGRLVPGIRMIIPVPAGLSRMPLATFFALLVVRHSVVDVAVGAFGLRLKGKLSSGWSLSWGGDALGFGVGTVRRVWLVSGAALATPFA